jgi:PIN domain nuclease of toxin-antitoxin system
MRVLLDTELLLWAAAEPRRLSRDIRDLLQSVDNEPLFSPASIWEIGSKAALGRSDFKIEPRGFRRALLDNGYVELPITSRHAVAVLEITTELSDIFDRLLVAQSIVERVPLLTSDPVVARYSGLTQS